MTVDEHLIACIIFVLRLEGAGGFFDEALRPEFKRQQAENDLDLTGFAPEVILEQLLQIATLEYSTDDIVGVEQDFAHTRTEFVIKPMMDGCAEGLLGPFEGEVGQERTHRLTQHDFVALHADVGGHISSELEQHRIKQRHAGFQRGGHRHFVGV